MFSQHLHFSCAILKKRILIPWAREQSFWKFMNEQLLESSFNFLVAEGDLILTNDVVTYPSSAHATA